MSYLLDANVFIQAHRFTYPIDVFPVFWQWLETENINGYIASIELIYKELEKGNDELAEWAKNIKSQSLFLPVDDEETQNNFAQIADWVLKQEYTEPAREEFLSVADPWLIAKAKTLNSTIVTLERSNPQRKNKIHIPDVCKAFDIAYINTIDLLRVRKSVFH